ncbi:MAG: hypothetical protein WD042_10120 [Phycisphaeraceae bacterium]
MELASKATLQATIPPAASPAQCTVVLRASVDGVSAAQTLHFMEQAGQWRLTQVQRQGAAP